MLRAKVITFASPQSNLVTALEHEEAKIKHMFSQSLSVIRDMAEEQKSHSLAANTIFLALGNPCDMLKINIQLQKYC